MRRSRRGSVKGTRKYATRRSLRARRCPLPSRPRAVPPRAVRSPMPPPLLSRRQRRRRCRRRCLLPYTRRPRRAARCRVRPRRAAAQCTQQMALAVAPLRRSPACTPRTSCCARRAAGLRMICSICRRAWPRAASPPRRIRPLRTPRPLRPTRARCAGSSSGSSRRCRRSSHRRREAATTSPPPAGERIGWGRHYPRRSRRAKRPLPCRTAARCRPSAARAARRARASISAPRPSWPPPRPAFPPARRISHNSLRRQRSVPCTRRTRCSRRTFEGTRRGAPNTSRCTPPCTTPPSLRCGRSSRCSGRGPRSRPLARLPPA